MPLALKNKRGSVNKGKMKIEVSRKRVLLQISDAKSLYLGVLYTLHELIGLERANPIVKPPL